MEVIALSHQIFVSQGARKVETYFNSVRVLGCSFYSFQTTQFGAAIVVSGQSLTADIEDSMFYRCGTGGMASGGSIFSQTAYLRMSRDCCIYGEATDGSFVYQAIEFTKSVTLDHISDCSNIRANYGGVYIRNGVQKVEHMNSTQMSMVYYGSGIYSREALSFDLKFFNYADSTAGASIEIFMENGITKFISYGNIINNSISLGVFRYNTPVEVRGCCLVGNGPSYANNNSAAHYLWLIDCVIDVLPTFNSLLVTNNCRIGEKSTLGVVIMQATRCHMKQPTDKFSMPAITVGGNTWAMVNSVVLLIVNI